MTDSAMERCPTCGSNNTGKKYRVQVDPNRPYHGQWCPDPFHSSVSVAKPVDSSIHYDDMDMGYRQKHNK